ncbi:MAG: protein kinase [bacterium]|nr:protein kinase [bacterium]
MKDYKTLRQIGHGGMSTVYLARQIPQNRLVAVKILKSATLSDPGYIKRFFREARITAQLDHPNIIRIIESNFSHTEGLFYIVTEYIDGGNFRHFQQQPGIGLQEKLRVLHKVLLALDYAHKRGIIHRDIKPSNILLTKKLVPKLCDFGIAAALWGQESQLTRTNEVMGTMDYIAPEQKESSRNVDGRADIYSIGVILYQLITGRKPQGAFPPPRDIVPFISPKLDQMVMKCLQPLPADRYKNAHNLADELFRSLDNLGNPGTIKPPASKGPGTQRDTKTEILRPEDDAVSIDTMIEKLGNGTIAEKLGVKPRFIKAVGEEHQQKLSRLLPEADGFLKETLIEVLGKLKSQETCSYLIELLSDPYYNKVAAAAIGEIGCTGAEEKLFKLLLTHGENSYIALLPLGKLNSIRSVDLISGYLTDRHIWVRELALDALALMDDPDPEGKGNDKIAGYLENISSNDANVTIRAKAKKILWRFKK